MIRFQRSIKSFCMMISGSTVLKPFRNFFLNSEIRRFATEETAVDVIKIRRLRKKKSNKILSLGSSVLLAIPLSSFGLGTWQVFRKLERDKQNEQFLDRIDKPPVELPENLDELKDMEFRKVRVRGKFDHSKEIYLGPRPKTDKYSGRRPLSLISTPTGGFFVITPFTLSDRNVTILVNRGWVPPPLKSPDTRFEGQIKEEVEIVGLVRKHENREPFGLKNVPEKGIWTHRDLNKMSEITGAAPIMIDADESSSVPGGPVGGQTFIQLRNDHMSYIITWYLLFAVSSYLWFLKYYKHSPIVV